MKVALVHDWLFCMRGGERVLEELCRLFPEATLFTLFHSPGSTCSRIESMPIRASLLNRIPGAQSHYRNLLPLYPWAISKFDLNGFDLIISNSHAVAKGIRKPAGTLHICSCLTPMRYLWDMGPDYFQYGDNLRLRRALLGLMRHPLRAWDRKTASRVDHFIANSRYVQQRIARYYGRSSDVVYSPVDTDFFRPSDDGKQEGFYLIVSALVPYKRVDLVIEAFNRLGRRLVIVGEGPDRRHLGKLAFPNIEFRGFVSNEELRELYRHCSAVIIAGREDFGLVSLEAQACGRPVIAYAAGGSLETVKDGETGILFSSQSTDDLAAAVHRLERSRFFPNSLRDHALLFSPERFRLKIQAIVTRKWREFRQEGENHEALPGDGRGY
jgi:glycosyltransferase involved in cell wall biosynthesis